MQAITDQEFGCFQRFMREAAGIHLSPAKKALVAGRLARRLHALGIASFGEYHALIAGAAGRAGETQTAIDLLTTNETYFFREPRHFELLRELAPHAAPLRVWSAACSSGEEAYSAAMVLADAVGLDRFEVVGTDISARVLARARAAHYAVDRARQVPPALLKRWCLKGIGPQEGTLLVDRALRDRVSFAQANLNEALPASLGRFEVAFLRNVMIYFDAGTKRRVVQRVASLLRPGGWLFIGHSETLGGMADGLQALGPAVFRKT